MKLLLIAIVGCLTAAAQTPPPILRLIRAPNISNSSARYSNAGSTVEVLGMRAMTGLGETGSWNSIPPSPASRIWTKP